MFLGMKVSEVSFLEYENKDPIVNKISQILD
jgi:hypothetical protein